MPSEGIRDTSPAPMSASLALSVRNIYETLAISFPTMLDAFGGRVTQQVCDERLERWSRHVVANAGIKLDLAGRANVTPGVTYLVMSNHQSLYDIPVLFHVLGPNIRMVAKKELFGVPVFGHALAAAGFVEVDRGNRQSAIRNLERAHALLSKGTHVWIAPEGTRSPTGKLLPFKKGGFHLALDASLPILPVTLRGTRDVLRARGILSNRGVTVRVTFHPPVEPASYAVRGKAGRQALMDDVRSALERGL
jgi:1-acyl-sn-glycerol-3-phosphate acyltransferase